MRDQIIVGRLSVDDFVTRRYNVRLDQVVVVLQALRVYIAAARRPARTVRGDDVVAAFVGAEGVGSPHRKRRWFIARRVHLAINLLPGVVDAVITNGRHHDNSCIHQFPHGTADRIVGV